MKISGESDHAHMLPEREANYSIKIRSQSHKNVALLCNSLRQLVTNSVKFGSEIVIRKVIQYIWYNIFVITITKKDEIWVCLN